VGAHGVLRSLQKDLRISSAWDEKHRIWIWIQVKNDDLHQKDSTWKIGFDQNGFDQKAWISKLMVKFEDRGRAISPPAPPQELILQQEISVASGANLRVMKAQEGMPPGEENLGSVSVRRLGDPIRPPPQLTVKDIHAHAAARSRTGAWASASARRNVGDAWTGPWAEELSQSAVTHEQDVDREPQGPRRSGSGSGAARAISVLLFFAAAVGLDGNGAATPNQGWSAMHKLIKREVFFFFFFFTLVTGPRRSLNLELSDTRVCEPQTQARGGCFRFHHSRM